jgi:TrmH family RNA methyltransferase
LIERITSRQNPRIKQVLRLHSSRGRQSLGKIIVFGTREVNRAIGAGVEFDELFFSDAEPEEMLSQFVPRTSGHATRLIRVADDVFAKIAYGDRIDEVIGIATRPATKLDNLKLPQSEDGCSLVLVVQAIEKPGNIGAIIRTADACGVAAVISADPLTDVFHPNSIRSSTGTVFHLPLATGSSSQVQAWLRENRFRVFVALLDHASDFFQAELTGNVALVLGNEASGLDEQWRQSDFNPVKLPMKGQADSLNVSVTSAVMMYEAMRQRQSGASK